MKEGTDFSGVTHYTHVDVQPGGINIQNVEHLYQADILKQLGIELQVKQKLEKKKMILQLNHKISIRLITCYMQYQVLRT